MGLVHQGINPLALDESPEVRNYPKQQGKNAHLGGSGEAQES